MKIKTTLLVTIIMICMTGVAFGGMFVESGEIPESMAAVAEAYWTPERMESAIPYPHLIEGEPQEVDPAELQVDIGEPPGWATGSKTGKPSVFMTREVDMEAKAKIEPVSASYPFPHTTYRISTRMYRRYPYRAVGKVFFRHANGGNYVCSGSSIGGRAVLTAGHCVSNGRGRWHPKRYWTFVPAYRRGNRPYGTWSASNLSTFKDWFYRGRFCRDVGIAVTRNRGGRRLSQRVGNLGYAVNQSRSKQHYDVFGYPGNRPWFGRDQVQTSAEWAKNDTGCSPRTIGIGTTQGPGSSGGPWIIKFYPDRGGRVNYANGVVSYGYSNRPRASYSPYFDTYVRDLIRWGTRQ